MLRGASARSAARERFRVRSDADDGKVTMRAVGVEPTTNGLKGRCGESITSDSANTCDNPADPLGVLLGVLRSECPDLAAVVAAWPTLPDAVRAGIVAMVRASAAADAAKP